jgi:hypothetical protein
MKQYDLPNYDNWLTELYDKLYEYDEELEEHITNLREMDEEEDQRNYCDDNHLKFHEVQPYL